MIKLLRIAQHILIFALLTLLTQVGGIIYLLLLPLVLWLTNSIQKRWKKYLAQLGVFSITYLFIISFILPPVAHYFGRIPLPVFGNSAIKPLNVWTCVFNRHYVRPTLLKTLQEVAQQLRQQYPDAVLAYMDANFPLKDGYPLWPHLSHNDGKKIDLAFLYKHPSSRKSLPGSAKSWIGYGGNETPTRGEYNVAKTCQKQGFWAYSLLYKAYPGFLKRKLIIDKQRTQRMVQLLARHAHTNRLYLEPYLKARWRLYSPKIRFHGCQSVRHDDHVHVSIW